MRPAPAGQNRVLPPIRSSRAAASTRAGWVKQEVDVSRRSSTTTSSLRGSRWRSTGSGTRRIRSLSGGVMLDAGWARGHAPLHRLELRAGTITGVARPLASRLSDARSARYLDVGRTVVPAYGAPRPCGRGVEHLPRRPLPAAVGRTSRCGREASAAHGQGALAVRGHDHDRALAAVVRRLRLLRASAVPRPARRRSSISSSARSSATASSSPGRWR